ncbi:sugar phosphate isomerase/epimerase family protein [Brachybacterium alimentarium]|uniref:sugar phosphate isomerase/epimerase family protein n=1 Tax=Brachybacterium alimentarium TaxID=47845 RepID=UPI003FD2DC18
MNSRMLAFSTLGEAGMTVDRIIDQARDAGARGVELRVAPGEVLDPSSSVEDAAAIGTALRSAGLTILALGSYVPLSSPERDRADSDLWHHLELAHAATACGVRVFMKKPAKQTFDDGNIEAAQRLGRVLPSAPRGVRVLVETHDSHSTAERMSQFLRSVPDALRAQVGIVWDTAHTWAAGEDAQRSLELLAPSLAYIQVKDLASAADPIPVPLGMGSYPISSLATALDRSGWTGPVSLEWEQTWHPELPPLAAALTSFPAWTRHAITQSSSTEPNESETA